MPQRWMGLDEWKSKIAKGVRPLDTGVRKAVPPEGIEVPAGEERVVKFVLSDGGVDRDKDVVNPKGWDLKNYQQNPVVMWAHDYSQAPIGRMKNVGFENGKLVGTAEFMPKELSPLGDTVYRMLKGGWLRGISVGFKPKSFDYAAERKGVDFHEQELLEASVVPIPSHPGALATAKSAGVDLAPIQKWATDMVVALKAIGGAMGHGDARAFTTPGMEDAGRGQGDPLRDNDGCPMGDFCPKMQNAPCPAAEGCPLGKQAHGSVVKVGRVLSGRNESAIKAAIEALNAVLAQLTKDGQEESAEKALGAEVIAKFIEERDGKFCVVSHDRSKTLGCHPTRGEALNHLRAIEANKARTLDGLAITRKQMETLCPSCAEKMSALNLSVLKLTPEVLAKAPEMSMKLCEQMGSDPGFFTACKEKTTSWDLSDPDGFCAKLHEMCTGHWPAEDKNKGLSDEEAARKAVDDVFTLGDESDEEDTVELAEDLTPEVIKSIAQKVGKDIAQDAAALRERQARGRVD